MHVRQKAAPHQAAGTDEGHTILLADVAEVDGLQEGPEAERHFVRG